MAVDNRMDITYGKTPLGQLLYDLGFTKLEPRYLAQKHHLPIAEIRRMRRVIKNTIKHPHKRRRRS